MLFEKTIAFQLTFSNQINQIGLDIFVVLVALKASGAFRRFFADVVGDVGGKAHVVALEASGADRRIFADVCGRYNSGKNLNNFFAYRKNNCIPTHIQ